MTNPHVHTMCTPQHRLRLQQRSAPPEATAQEDRIAALEHEAADLRAALAARGGPLLNFSMWVLCTFPAWPYCRDLYDPFVMPHNAEVGVRRERCMSLIVKLYIYHIRNQQSALLRRP